MPSGQRCLLHSVPPAPHLDPERKAVIPSSGRGKNVLFFVTYGKGLRRSPYSSSHSKLNKTKAMWCSKKALDWRKSFQFDPHLYFSYLFNLLLIPDRTDSCFVN
jgi:hypothetical protein